MNNITEQIMKFFELELMGRVYAFTIFAIVIFSFLLIVSIKYYVFVVKVNMPIEASQGMIQRAAAFEKLVNQTGSIDSKIPEKSTIKNIVFGWFAEITIPETKYALEFIDYSVETYDMLNKENIICGTLTHDFYNGLDSDEISIARVISHEINDFNDNASDSSKEILTRIFERNYPCV
jgi:hypothetical protein